MPARAAPVRPVTNDGRDDMALAEPVEELELSHPEKLASFERRHPDAMAAVAKDHLGASDPEESQLPAGSARRDNDALSPSMSLFW